MYSTRLLWHYTCTSVSMNISRNDSDDLSDLYTSVVLMSMQFVVYPFYIYWVLYFLNEVVFLRRKIRGLLHRTPTLETSNELFKYTGNYYTYILVVVIALLETNSLIPASLSLLPFLLEHGKAASIHSSDIRTVSYILCMILTTLLNLVTTHLIRVCKSDTRVKLLPPIHNKLAILTLFTLVLVLIKLVLIENLLVLILANIINTHEMIQLFKHSKQLYRLLKWRYEDMRYEEDHHLYRAHRRIAIRYKYFSIPFLSAMTLLIMGSWLNISVTEYYIRIYYDYPYVAQKLNLPMSIIEWGARGMCVIGSLSSFLIPLYTTYNLVAICLHKIGSPLGRNRIRFEPLLQH